MKIKKSNFTDESSRAKLELEVLKTLQDVTSNTEAGILLKDLEVQVYELMKVDEERSPQLEYLKMYIINLQKNSL